MPGIRQCAPNAEKAVHERIVDGTLEAAKLLNSSRMVGLNDLWHDVDPLTTVLAEIHRPRTLQFRCPCRQFLTIDLHDLRVNFTFGQTKLERAHVLRLH